ncbi:MAG: tetratricopeptide repeat protein [Planctomycetes bacterium]|nr:tetratricopeptide repeat protein [Planctomycetota bacterium]
MKQRTVLVLLAVTALALGLWWRLRLTPPPAPESVPAAEVAPGPTAPAPSASMVPLGPSAGFEDERGCVACHAAEAQLWSSSDHARALQVASDETVLGDFAEARFHDGSTDTLFTREEKRFVVETEGPDGARARFDVPYVFGLDPLQQLLLPTERGRLQALSVAWDARAKRWYSLYPSEHIDARDPLHWTRPAQNWNFSCAECHATELKRNYDARADSYATSWNRLDVGCQACHGPAARHLDWALGRTDDGPASGHGFDAPLSVPQSSVEVEACARCHARRAPLGDGFDHRNRLLDDYLPALLSADLYFADGQIQDEVYEYGSFLQSKMHQHGLRCSDCHEPHSSALRQSGNLMCVTCHSPTPNARAHVDTATLQKKAYDSGEHHHHAPGTPGSQCVDCHMPLRTYMGIDARRDHGFRVPRPDLAEATGAPSACVACHAEKGEAWAAERVVEWFGKQARPEHWGVALQQGRSGAPGAAAALLALTREALPAIVRATALQELARYPGRAMLEACTSATTDADGLVRLAALSGLALLPPEQRVEALAPLLVDPLRGVRIEVARLLDEAPAEALGPHAAAQRAASAEYEAVQRALLERPEGRLNLAQVLLQRGESAAAEAQLRAAVRLDPSFAPAWVNLSELVRGVRSEREAEGVLRDGLGQVPEAASAALQQALGLTLVRQGKKDEARAALARAAELAPAEPYFAYVHAVALHDLGDPAGARATLVTLLQRHPDAREARLALAEYCQEAGDAEGARRTLAELAAINPDDPALGGPPPGR